MKTLERKALKQRITNLANEQFSDLLKTVRFSGPFEDEDLDADLILRERIPLMEIGEKLWNIYRPLLEDGYDVLIAHRYDRSKKKNRAQKQSR